MPELFAYTDGACSGNPGPGGWGVLMIARENGVVVKERELSGGEAQTTNNRVGHRMEAEELAHGWRLSGQERRALTKA
jgi:ribonuclease HI